MQSFKRVFLLVLFHNVLGEIKKGHLFDEEIEPDLIEAGFNLTDIGHQIRGLIEHFKKPDPVGLPGAPIPDPLPTPDTRITQSMVAFTLTNVKIHGLSKFRVKEISTNLDSLELDILLTYEKLEIIGNYTAVYFFQRNTGGFNITSIEVSMGGTAALSTNRNGHLEASKLDMDLSFKDVIIDFKNLGFILALIQNAINQMGSLVFDAVKPQVLKEVNINIKNDVNKALSKLKKTFPNSIPPLDLAIAEGRKAVRESGYDPFPLEDYKYSAGLMTVHVRDIWLSGIASFYRIGNVSIAIKRNSVSVASYVSTQQLEGKCTWEASFGSMFSTHGSTSYSVQYVQVLTRFNQSLDLRKRLILEDMDIRVGNVQLRMDGMGTLDYGFELLANILPNILRNEIVDAVESTLKQRIRNILGALDIEELVERHVIRALDTVMATNDTVTTLEDSFEISEEYDEMLF